MNTNEYMRDYMRKQYAEKPAIREAQIARSLARYYNSTRTSVQQENLDRKIDVLTHYGLNSMLQCCGEDCKIIDHDMLTLDHINNDGAVHRKTITTGIYRWIQSHDYPAGFQTLCWNHQMKKELARRRIENM
jgi:hypothetical protein